MCSARRPNEFGPTKRDVLRRCEFIRTCEVGPIRSGSIGELHLLQKRLPARIAAETSQQSVRVDRAQARVMLRIGALKPLEGGIYLSAVSIDLRHLIGALLRVFVDQLAQRGVGLL